MSDGVNNFVDNSELIEYLKSRKNVQTEVEMKSIMGKIYECIALNSKLFYAFNSSVPPTTNENGENVFDEAADKKLALIYSEKAEAYLPIYTTVEESKNRGNTEQFPYIRQVDFEEYSNLVLNSDSKIEGLVINPFTDNLILSKSKIEHLLNKKLEVTKKVEEVAVVEPKIVPKVEPIVEPVIELKPDPIVTTSTDENVTSKITGKASLSATSGVYVKNNKVKRKKGILINEYDLRILEYNMLPNRVTKAALNFAQKQDSINAMWMFDKRYYLENDNTQYLAQLFVVEDTCVTEEERKELFNELKEEMLMNSNANEIHVESINEQKDDYVRKNAVLPFYQKINVQGKYEKINNVLEEHVPLDNEIIEEIVETTNEPENTEGWDSIEAEFFRVYPNQVNPKHYAPLIKWKFGGPDPLDGISVYDAGEYWHFVTFGLTELYKKEKENPAVSGFGFEFTYKLKKGCYDDEEAEIKAACALLQQLGKLVIVDKAIIKPNEYLYTGQTEGVDSKGRSKITGFITMPDSTVNIINTPNGKVEFLQLIGVTDSELKMVMEKKINVRELYGEIPSDVTDYMRAAIQI